MAVEEPVALVTGAEDPLARCLACELIRRAWTVALQSTDPEVLGAPEYESIPPEYAGRVCPCLVDTSTAPGRERLVESVLDELGRIDLLVLFPPVPPGGQDVLELPEDACAEALREGVVGPLMLTQLVANEMVRLAEAGIVEAPRIVLVNSIAAYTTSTGRASQCLAAAALGMLTRLFADALGDHGINVYEVRTGLISTGPSDPIRPRYERLIEEGLTPIRRWGRPEDVARAVAAVAEDMLAFSTGEVINVDGGFRLRRL